MPRHLSRDARRAALIDKTLAAVQERLTKEINYWDRRAAELRALEAGGRQPSQRLNAALAQQRADELAERLARRKEALALQRQISASAPVVVGGALVLPAGRVGGASAAGQPVDRAIVEAIAMQAVMEREIALGHSPRDVRQKLPRRGEPDPTGRLRFIESKAAAPTPIRLPSPATKS